MSGLDTLAKRNRENYDGCVIKQQASNGIIRNKKRNYFNKV